MNGEVLKTILVLLSLIATVVAPILRIFLRPPERPIAIPPRQASSEVMGEPVRVRPVSPETPLPSGQKIFISFGVLLGILAVITLVIYYESIVANLDTIVFGVWLFVVMAGGMFVQVIFTNYQAGKGLVNMSASELLLPLCFSVVVYYSIWTVAASAPRGIFPFYAAFVNGYFWRNVVSSMKPIQQRSSGK